MRIGIDMMGGECSPLILFNAIDKASVEYPCECFVIFLTLDAYTEISNQYPERISLSQNVLKFQIVLDVIEMEDDPLVAIRKKNSSSLVLGLELLKKRDLDAFISLGNTGALIAGATLLLPLLPGIKRPALLANLPTKRTNVAIIDVGGNVLCKASHLVQFAQLGIAYQRSCHGIKIPRVGLLNIGVESKKGTSEVRKAYQLLVEKDQSHELHFVGNIEGRDVFQGVVDVLVTDGFTGNILLKTSEGVSSFILAHLKGLFEEISLDQKSKILERLHQRFDSDEHSGAIICGIDAIIVKCHGQTSSRGFFKAIQKAIELVKNGFIKQIKQKLE